MYLPHFPSLKISSLSFVRLANVKKPDLTNQQSTVLPPLRLPAKTPAITEGTVDESLKSESQYVKLRKARSDARLVGQREKRTKLKAEEEAAKGKK
jgi:hypothetical protein